MTIPRDAEELPSSDGPRLPNLSHRSTQANGTESSSSKKEPLTYRDVTPSPENVSGSPSMKPRDPDIKDPPFHKTLPTCHASFNYTITDRQGPSTIGSTNTLLAIPKEMPEYLEHNLIGKRPGTTMEGNFSPSKYQHSESAEDLTKIYASPPQPHFPNTLSRNDTVGIVDRSSDPSRSPFGTRQASHHPEMGFQALPFARHPSSFQYADTVRSSPYSQHITPGTYRAHDFLSPTNGHEYGRSFDERYNRPSGQNSIPYGRQKSTVRDDRDHIQKDHSGRSSMHLRPGSATANDEEYRKRQLMAPDNYCSNSNQRRSPFRDFENRDFLHGSVRNSCSSGSRFRTGQELHNITRRQSQLGSPIFSNGKTSGRQPSRASTELPTYYRNPWGGHSVQKASSVRISSSQSRPSPYGLIPEVDCNNSGKYFRHTRNMAPPLSSETSTTLADDEEDESIEEILRRNRPRADMFNTPPAFNRTETLDFEGSQLRKAREYSSRLETRNRFIQNANGIGRSHDIRTHVFNSARSTTDVVDLTTPINRSDPTRDGPLSASQTQNTPANISTSGFTHKQAEMQRQAAERIALLEERARRIKNHDDLFEEPLEDEEAEARLKKSARLDIGRKRVKEKAQLINTFQKQMAEALAAKQKQEEQEDLEKRRAERKKKTTNSERKRREEIEADRLEMKRIQSLKYSDRERRRHEAIMAKAEEDAKRETAKISLPRPTTSAGIGQGKDKSSKDCEFGTNTDTGLFISDDDEPPNEIANSHLLPGVNDAGCEVDVEMDVPRELSCPAERVSEGDMHTSDSVGQEISGSGEISTHLSTLPNTGSINEVAAEPAPKAFSTTQATLKAPVTAKARENRQRASWTDSRLSIQHQGETKTKETSSRARRGWVVARATERVERQCYQVIENKRKEVERLQEELVAQEEQRQKDWEKQEEQRNNEWEAQMSQLAQINKLIGDKTESILEMAVEKAVAKIVATVAVPTASQSFGISQNLRPMTFNSTVTFVSQAAAQAEEKRKAEEARLKKFENDRRNMEKRYEREIRKTLESQGLEQNEEKIRNTMEEKIQQWEERRKKKELKILGGNNECLRLLDDHQNQESSPATVHDTEESENDSETVEAKKREGIVRAGVSFLASMNKTSKDFANAAAKQRVDFLDGDDSEESEEDPDDEPETSQKPMAQENLSANERDADGDVNMDFGPDDIDHRVIPQILSTCASSATEPQHLPIQIANYPEADMIHAYKVHHLRERDGIVEPHVVLQTFHNLGDANTFAAQQLGSLYLSVNQALTGRSEMHDADNLYRGKITIQDQPDWAEIIYVIREISYLGAIVNLPRADVQPIINPKVFNVIKETVQTNKDFDVNVVACTSIKILANKLAADGYLALAKPVTANMDLVTHYHEVVVPDVRARLDLADERGEVIDLEPGENLKAGLKCFRVSVSENAVRGPLN